MSGSGTATVSRVGTQVARASLEGKFLDFLETIPDALILSDYHGRIILVNTNTERMFGYLRDELLGKEIEILIPKRVQARHQRHRNVYYADSNIRPMGVGEDLSACGKDGVEFPVEISLSPIKIKGNAYVWSAIRNIDYRQRSLAQLREAIQNKLIAFRDLVS